MQLAGRLDLVRQHVQRVCVYSRIHSNLNMYYFLPDLV